MKSFMCSSHKRGKQRRMKREFTQGRYIIGIYVLIDDRISVWTLMQLHSDLVFQDVYTY